MLALRLYTSNSYPCVNQALRRDTQPHPFPATTFCIYDGLRKLRRINSGAADAAAPRIFWRGLADRMAPDGVLAEGGTELGCLSTTVSEDQVRNWVTPLLFQVVAREWVSWGRGHLVLVDVPGRAGVAVSSSDVSQFQGQHCRRGLLTSQSSED
jgi:hypothetical protein